MSSSQDFRIFSDVGLILKSAFLKKKAKIDLPIQRLSLMTLGYIEMAAFGSEIHTGTSHIDIIV
jgi:hypothetical protein